MMKRFSKFFTLPVLLTLTACGFSPIYGNYTRSDAISVERSLANIEINIIPNKEGQYIRNELIDRFYKNGYPTNPKYTLSIQNIDESTSNLDITKSSDATRAQLKLTTSMRLIDAETGKTLITKPLRAITSYNILSSQFTTRVSEEDARKAALNELANQIETSIALYLNKQL